ncbi:phage major capsid protein [Rhodomicrobium lacus]|uniref:phage major capsid protein n=1 Tax=Rhodomicrobium lacus TaxID=2498452 RepID=UPI000F8C5236|nr:phage major capsid protein [Rhodomicrobium lacus]
MPEATETQDVIARSRETRERISAEMAARNGERRAPRAERPHHRDMRAAIDEMNRSLAALRDDVGTRLTALEKRNGRDPLAQLREDRLADEAARTEDAVRQLTKPSAAARPGTSKQETEYKGEFFAFMRKGATGKLESITPQARAASTFDVDRGGFLVPEEWETGIERVLETDTVMRSLASVRSVTTQKLAKMASIGGTNVSNVGELDDRGETDMSRLRKLEFQVHERYAQPIITEILLEDANFDIEGWIRSELEIAYRDDEARTFLLGNGTSEPQGLLTVPVKAQAGYGDYDASADYGKVGYVKTGGATGFAASSPSDVFLDVLYCLKSASLKSSRWLMHRTTAAQVRKFKLTTGEYLWEQSFQGGVLQPTLLGYPIDFDDFMPTLGANKFPIAFGDFARTYLILDRKGVTMTRDNLTRKGFVKFYTTKRYGGGVQSFEHMKFLKCEA